MGQSSPVSDPGNISTTMKFLLAIVALFAALAMALAEPEPEPYYGYGGYGRGYGYGYGRGYGGYYRGKRSADADSTVTASNQFLSICLEESLKCKSKTGVLIIMKSPIKV